MFLCNECMGFHAPMGPSMGGGGMGGGAGGMGGLIPIGGHLGGLGGGGGMVPVPKRNPWGDIDPFEGAISGAITGLGGRRGGSGGGGRFPAPGPVWEPAPVREPAPSPAPTRPPPARIPPSSSGRSRPTKSGRNKNYSVSITTPSGGIEDHRQVEVPQLTPTNPANRIKPTNPNESFLNSSMFGGADKHPHAPEFPKRLSGRPPAVPSQTPEEQSARAFVIWCITIIKFNDFAEDMYVLYKKGKVPEKLVKHIKYFLRTVLPHLQANGEMPPGDYCKIRAMLDWCAEIGDVFGTAGAWTFGLGKGKGHARETKWWRNERLGFQEAPGV